ncbi:MAG: hypothetical protein JXR03_04765 [Cyclobacteriaceae bacterium]
MLIKDHSQFSDEEFEHQFESFKLKPRLFSHEAHLRLAYIHIKKYGVNRAEQNMCQQIKGYAESLGVFDKFNKTVTIASVKVMNHFMQKSEPDSFTDLTHEFPNLLDDFKGILRQHYGFNVFADKQAKKEFIEPDLLSF